MSESKVGDQWLSKREACRRLGIGRRAVEALVRNESIVVRRLPGLPERFSAADVERLMSGYTYLAKRVEELNEEQS